MSFATKPVKGRKSKRGNEIEGVWKATAGSTRPSGTAVDIRRDAADESQQSDSRRSAAEEIGERQAARRRRLAERWPSRPAGRRRN